MSSKRSLAHYSSGFIVRRLTLDAIVLASFLKFLWAVWKYFACEIKTVHGLMDRFTWSMYENYIAHIMLTEEFLKWLHCDSCRSWNITVNITWIKLKSIQQWREYKQAEILLCVINLLVNTILVSWLFFCQANTIYSDTLIYPSFHVLTEHWTLTLIISMNSSSSTSTDVLHIIWTDRLEEAAPWNGNQTGLRAITLLFASCLLQETFNNLACCSHC